MRLDPRSAPGPTKRSILGRTATLTVAYLLAATLMPAAASAHGISGRVSLPVPAWLFAWPAVSSILLGNWFSAFSPWRAFARALSWVAARLHLESRAPLSYPGWLGRWPVVAGLLAFGWLELVYHDHDNPTLLASLSLAYFVLMLIGMALFGIKDWSEKGDRIPRVQPARRRHELLRHGWLAHQLRHPWLDRDLVRAGSRAR
jgi:hypothetical protein